ncbi:hypothetical protein LINPERPRIM_LOCUS23384 [Linum perenne]
MADLVKLMLAKRIQLADQVIKSADKASVFKEECSKVKSMVEKLAALLRQAARERSDLYQRPTCRIVHGTEQVLDKALTLVLKCQGERIINRVITIIPTSEFRVKDQLENSIRDVSWLLRVSAAAGLSPIDANLRLIWEQISVLDTSSLDNRSHAAALLGSMTRDDHRCFKLIIEEGGVQPLLKLAEDGEPEGQENAARAIGFLGRDKESVEHMVQAGVCSVFAKILKEGGPMKVQAVVSWAISELAAHHPKCQHLFAHHDIICSLVAHLAFETVEEHSRYALASHKSILATNNSSSTVNQMQQEHLGT